MPTPTPEQLKEARLRKAEERRAAEEAKANAEKTKRQEVRERLEQARIEERNTWEKVREVLLPQIERYDDLASKFQRLQVLDSVLTGYYNEMDKLCKKAPADQVTELFLGRVNAVIQEVKMLLSGDTFIDSTVIFVPAGERPEHRDVLLVLSELRQGLQRAVAEHNLLDARYEKLNWYQYREEYGEFREITEEDIDNAIEAEEAARRPQVGQRPTVRGYGY